MWTRLQLLRNRNISRKNDAYFAEEISSNMEPIERESLGYLLRGD